MKIHLVLKQTSWRDLHGNPSGPTEIYAAYMSKDKAKEVAKAKESKATHYNYFVRSINVIENLNDTNNT